MPPFLADLDGLVAGPISDRGQCRDNDPRDHSSLPQLGILLSFVAVQMYSGLILSFSASSRTSPGSNSAKWAHGSMRSDLMKSRADKRSRRRARIPFA